MMVIKRFSNNRILNTNAPGFIKGRKYDMDINRLGRMDTSQRELHKQLGSINSETRKMNKELNLGMLGKWKDMN